MGVGGAGGRWGAMGWGVGGLNQCKADRAHTVNIVIDFIFFFKDLHTGIDHSITAECLFESGRWEANVVRCACVVDC